MYDGELCMGMKKEEGWYTVYGENGRRDVCMSMKDRRRDAGV